MADLTSVRTPHLKIVEPTEPDDDEYEKVIDVVIRESYTELDDGSYIINELTPEDHFWANGPWYPDMVRPKFIHLDTTNLRSYYEFTHHFGLIGGKIIDLTTGQKVTAEELGIHGIDFRRKDDKEDKSLMGEMAFKTKVIQHLPKIQAMVYAPGYPQWIFDEYYNPKTCEFSPKPDNIIFNTYQPVQPPAISGTFEECEERADPWIQFMLKVWGREQFDIFLNFVGYTLHNPGQRHGFALIMASDEGGFKDGSLEPICHMMGGNANPSVNHAITLEKYTDWIVDKTLVVVQEPDGDAKSDDKKFAANFYKDIIGDRPPTKEVRGFGRGLYKVRKWANIIFLTNSTVAIHISTTDRRYALIHAKTKLSKESGAQYFTGDAVVKGGLDHWFENGGSEAIAEYVYRRTIDPAWNPKYPPNTEAKEVAQKTSLSSIAADLDEFLEDRDIVSRKELENFLDRRDSNVKYKLTTPSVVTALSALRWEMKKNPNNPKGKGRWGSGNAKGNVYAPIDVVMDNQIATAELKRYLEPKRLNKTGMAIANKVKKAGSHQWDEEWE